MDGVGRGLEASVLITCFLGLLSASHLFFSLEQSLADVKGQIVTVLGFVDHTFSVTTTQLCPCATEATMSTM